MSLKEFFMPEYTKLITYLILVLIFLSEIFIIRSVNREDYMISFISNIYYSHLSGMGEYFSLFVFAFFFYVAILFILYSLGCLIVLINKRKK